MEYTFWCFGGSSDFETVGISDSRFTWSRRFFSSLSVFVKNISGVDIISFSLGLFCD